MLKHKTIRYRINMFQGIEPILSRDTSNLALMYSLGVVQLGGVVPGYP